MIERLLLPPPVCPAGPPAGALPTPMPVRAAAGALARLRRGARAAAMSLALGLGGGAAAAAATESGQDEATAQAVRAAEAGEIAGRVFMLRDGRREELAWALVELRNAAGEAVEARITARDGRFRFTGVRDDRYRLVLGGGLRSMAEPREVEVGPAQRRHVDVDIVSPMRVVAWSPPASRGASPGEASAASLTGAPVPGEARPAAAVAAGPAPAPGSDPATDPATEAGRPAPAVEAGAPTPPAAPAQALRGAAAQLGAFGARANAAQHLHALTARGLLADSEAGIVATERGGRVLHRVLATPRRGSAAALCRTLVARGERCIVVRR